MWMPLSEARKLPAPLCVVVIAIAFSGLVVVACGGQGENRTPSSTLRERPGEDGFREFMPLLQDALHRRDVPFLMNRLKTKDVVCRAEDVPTNTGGPQCESVGQSYAGFPVSHWRSEGGIVPVSAVEAQFNTLFSSLTPSGSDGFGAGAARVYAVDIGQDRYNAIISAMIERPSGFSGTGPLRVAINTTWSFEGGRWLLNGILTAYVGAEDLLAPTDIGRMAFPYWERVQSQ